MKKRRKVFDENVVHVYMKFSKNIKRTNYSSLLQKLMILCVIFDKLNSYINFHHYFQFFLEFKYLSLSI